MPQIVIITVVHKQYKSISGIQIHKRVQLELEHLSAHDLCTISARVYELLLYYRNQMKV